VFDLYTCCQLGTDIYSKLTTLAYATEDPLTAKQRSEITEHHRLTAHVRPLRHHHIRQSQQTTHTLAEQIAVAEDEDAWPRSTMPKTVVEQLTALLSLLQQSFQRTQDATLQTAESCRMVEPTVVVIDVDSDGESE
jgi:hypothetical protein